MRAFSLVEVTENAGVGCVGGSQRREHRWQKSLSACVQADRSLEFKVMLYTKQQSQGRELLRVHLIGHWALADTHFVPATILTHKHPSTLVLLFHS